MINEQDIIFDEISNEVFLYLEELRESGVTNMFGAHQYVMEDFEISKPLAIKLVKTWMDSYNEEKTMVESKSNG
jgi:antitoxin component HigA of HigAB toxin-antitoxin module